MQFQIYHLDVSSSLSMKPDVSKSIMQARKPYRKLDSTLIEYYCVSKSDSLEVVEDHPEQTFDSFIKEKCLLIKLLLEQGVYRLVAKIKAKNHIDAFVKATSINQIWFYKKSKDIEVIGQPLRSTGADDLIEWDNKYYLICPLGYIDLERAAYFAMPG